MPAGSPWPGSGWPPRCRSSLLAPLAGRLVDRFDSRTLLVATGLAQAAVCAALAFVDHTVALIALVALLASGLAVTQPTFAALVPAMVTPRRPAEGQRDQADRVDDRRAARPGARRLAGRCSSASGRRCCSTRLTYLAIAVAGLLLRTRRGGGGAAAPGRRRRGAGRTVAAARATRCCSPWSLAFGAVVAGVGGVNVIEVFFIRETLGASATAYGLVTAAWTAGMLAGAWVLARFASRCATTAAWSCGMLVLLGATCVPVVISAGGARCRARWCRSGWSAALLNGGLERASATC